MVAEYLHWFPKPQLPPKPDCQPDLSLLGQLRRSLGQVHKQVREKQAASPLDAVVHQIRRAGTTEEGGQKGETLTPPGEIHNNGCYTD